MNGQEARRGLSLEPKQVALVRHFPTKVLKSDNVVPVVLEFNQPPVAVYQRQNPLANVEEYRAQLAAQHKEFLQRLTDTGIDVKMGSSAVVQMGVGGERIVHVPHDFTDVFNGVGVLMPGRMVAQVSEMAAVRAITLNEERVYLNLDRSVPFSGAPRVWERVDAAGKALKGEGIKVAVIDTGVDWTHPAFGGFAEVPNEKVIYAASYTGENPIDNFGHGTHVAAIVAADKEYQGTPRGDSQVDGMAPKAQIMGYKVLTASGSGSATNIILAIEDAVRRGAQIINLSLGDMLGDPFSPECAAANNAMLSGCVVCAAAGNAGPTPSSVGSPGAAHHVITMPWSQWHTRLGERRDAEALRKIPINSGCHELS